MGVSYDFCLFSSLFLAYVAAVLQFVLAFIPKFSATVLMNALLLTTVFVPLATNRFDLGREAGFWLWVGNVLFFAVLVGLWAASGGSATARPALGSLVGMLAFGLHVLVFAAVP